MSGLSEIEIRVATPDDAGAIAAVLLEAFSVFSSDYTPEAFAIVTPPATEVMGRFDEGPMWVACRGDEIVGTVSAVPEPEWLYIRSMAVSSAVQGQGVGHRLIDAVEEYARENGFDRLFLYTTYFSKGAMGLYEKHGFVRGSDTTAESWYGTPGLEMEKGLNRDIKT